MSGKKKSKKPKKLSNDFRTRLLKTTISIFAIAIVVVIIALTFFVHASTSSLLNTYNNNMEKSIKDECNVFWGEQYFPAFNLVYENNKKSDIKKAFKKEIQKEVLAQISIVNKKGIVTLSSDDDFIGYDLTKNKDFDCFNPLYGNSDELIASDSFIKYPLKKNVSYKYFASGLDDDHILLIAVKESTYHLNILIGLYAKTRYNSVGEKGFTAVTDEKQRYLDVPDSQKITELKQLGFSMDTLKKQERNHIYETKIRGEEFYYSYDKYETFYTITFIPKSEVVSSWYNMMAIITVLAVIMLVSMFIHVNRLNKRLVVKRINDINSGLNDITNGKLDTVIDVRSNKEFSELSDDINSTVNTLKGYIEREAKRIDAELEFARNIQHSALPNVFPPFPDRSDIDIYALMEAAKVVGGDFYDFFLTESNKLAFIIADVSDKGIPAALFMMKAKAVVKSLAQSGKQIDEVLSIANDILCEGNEENMFVTLWLGVLDTDTGALEYANAGHCFPIIKSSGKSTFLECKPGMPLGAMDGISFKKYETRIEKGDVVFLYTDGVTEAENTSGELYGKDRLLDTFNNLKHSESAYDICAEVKSEIINFTYGAEQSDDLTMLAVLYK